MSPRTLTKEILVVDDDQAVRWTLKEALQSWGFTAVVAGTVAEGTKFFNVHVLVAVLLDIDLPDGSGLDVLRAIKNEHDDAIVIMITGNVQVENTISALRGGAYDFIGKPINLEDLRVTICYAIEAKQKKHKKKQKKKKQKKEFNFRQIVGESPAMKKMLGF